MAPKAFSIRYPEFYRIGPDTEEAVFNVIMCSLRIRERMRDTPDSFRDQTMRHDPRFATSFFQQHLSDEDVDLVITWCVAASKGVQRDGDWIKAGRVMKSCWIIYVFRVNICAYTNKETNCICKQTFETIIKAVHPSAFVMLGSAPRRRSSDTTTV
ncbi:hypothetical protein MY1884_004375 [Beauveria asiatica]